MRRRKFLQGLGTSMLALPVARLWAAPADTSGQKLLVVMLRGAYDGLSLLLPHGSSFYYESRPNIAVPRPAAGDPNSAIDLGAGYGLHPALRGSLLPLWRSGQLALVPFCGSEDTSRSHFEAQDRMEMGQGAAGRPDYGSGYLNRLLEVLGGPTGALCFTSSLALSLKGSIPVPNQPLQLGGVRTVDPHQASAIEAMYKGRNLGPMVEEGFDTQNRLAQELEPQAGRGARGARGFEQMAPALATVLRDDHYQIGFVDVGGWDTHINQGGASGNLAQNLSNLSAGLAALAAGMGARWRDTTVVVLSEFGRTFRENGTRGTDHGHGNTLWVLGGSLTGGRIVGRQVELNAGALYQQRDLPVLNDYRGVLAHLFQRRFGLSRAQLERVLPGAPALDLQIA